ncbi:hypothetical protein ZWY2020_030301 [Hordeum vulgare]|nr:hypothetical protein ZWY2020_030301 [Hordeum vulgare]
MSPVPSQPTAEARGAQVQPSRAITSLPRPERQPTTRPSQRRPTTIDSALQPATSSTGPHRHPPAWPPSSNVACPEAHCRICRRFPDYAAHVPSLAPAAAGSSTFGRIWRVDARSVEPLTVEPSDIIPTAGCHRPRHRRRPCPPSSRRDRPIPGLPWPSIHAAGPPQPAPSHPSSSVR